MTNHNLCFEQKPNIITICLSISKLWSTQDLGFRRDNYTWGKKKRKFKFLNTESLFVNKLI